MIKYIYISILLLSFGNIFAQKSNGLLIELSELLQNNNISHDLFYNNEDDVLDINGYQIDLTFAKVRYEEAEGAALGFQCQGIEPDCVYDPASDKHYGNFTIRMKDKENVYKAINLINRLTD